jgi:hypothetical protein
MNRRWQADGIPLWRKLFSSNWWWYGEVNPDPAGLPSPENRPKFWRGDAIFFAFLTLGIPILGSIKIEMNARYWPFNQTSTYVGRVADMKYTYPQLQVELQDKTLVHMGLPMNEPLGFPNTTQRINRWISTVDRIKSRQYDCPDRLLALDAQYLNLSFRPILNVWEVRCASGSVLIPSKEIIQVWADFNALGASRLYMITSSIMVFCVVLIIRRERKRYVKS